MPETENHRHFFIQKLTKILRINLWLKSSEITNYKRSDKLHLLQISKSEIIFLPHTVSDKNKGNKSIITTIKCTKHDIFIIYLRGHMIFKYEKGSIIFLLIIHTYVYYARLI